MQHIARGLASFGRGPDTELVHMTKGEVAGLQALAKRHGGSLTINPKTGLPEAGFLSRILPMALTAAATIYGGPAAGAAVNGALTYAETKDLGKSALAAGMTYGMGQATAGMEGMGQEAAALEGASTVPAGGAGLTGSEFTPPAAPSAGAPLDAVKEAADRAAGAKAAADPAVGTQVGQRVSDFGAKYATAKGVDPTTLPESTRMANLSYGAKQLTSMSGLKDLYGRMTPLGLAGLGAGALQMGGAFTPKPTVMPTGSAIVSGFNPNAKRTTPVTLPGQNAPADSSERRYFNEGYPYAMGGSVPNENQFYPGANIARGGASNAPQAPSATDVMGGYDQSINQYTGEPTQMAGGGLASLNEYAAGGRLLDGEGDGMSDSIPAVIKGAKPQRAALAQGEFVVPADVVSHLGNGSTKAGSQRLYAMMDKVRHARTGTKKQGRQIKPEQFIPA